MPSRFRRALARPRAHRLLLPGVALASTGLGTGTAGVVHGLWDVGEVSTVLFALGSALALSPHVPVPTVPGNDEVPGASARVNWHDFPVATYIGQADPRGVTYVSPELESLVGYPASAWTRDPRFWAKIVHSADRERVESARALLIEAGTPLRVEYRITTADGREMWVCDEAVLAIIGADGSSQVQYGVLTDITERKRMEHQLRHSALHDSLTDLPNRTLLVDRLQQAIAVAKREGGQLAVLLMDLDRFKEINDTFGHDYGDLLLRQVVSSVRSALRETDTFARLGGDEFALILPGADESGAIHGVQKLLSVLSSPFSGNGHAFDVHATIGVSLFPQHAGEAGMLLQRAEIAMYRAKQDREPFRVYETDDDQRSPERLSLLRDLRFAAERGELALHYQPKAQVGAGETRHVEALIRWHHPVHGTIEPVRFLPMAEQAGLMKPLSVWVVDTALRQAAAWREAGLEIAVAVNLSPRTLHDPDLVRIVLDSLEKWELAPGNLEIEITEGALMIDPVAAMRTLTELHDAGISISIDDFGTGYSSLSYLTRLPADQIKIDKSFVRDMTRNDRSASIVQSVIEIGHNLRLQVVAEGVEDQATWDLLAGMGCDVAQGYLLSRPLPAEQIGVWLRETRPIPARKVIASAAAKA